jgi:hypothetical protein
MMMTVYRLWPSGPYLLRGIFTGAFFLSALLLNAAAALAAERNYKLSLSEDVAIAFYREIGSMPDFEHWVMSADKYIEAEGINKPVILESETARLQQKFYNYKPGEDILTVRIPVRAKIIHVLDNKENPYLLTFKPREEEQTYYPYIVGDIWFALIIGDLADKLVYPLTNWERNAITARYSGLRNQHAYVDLYMHVRVRSVDASAPVHMDGQYQWLIMTEGVSASLRKHGEIVWEYQQSWYRDENMEEIRKLFRE